ncbi:MAG: hypothetical protein HY308_18090 [Gammaproteobacteria bacterium]|nr:hypothetical protein [Gammaproteobacteria bacterium]
MSVLLVICDVSDPDKRTKIFNTIKRRYRSWTALSESCCAIYTPLLPIKVYDDLKIFLNADDQLYVIQLAKPYTGFGPRKTTEWLSDYLPVQSKN